jgi:hypothetical protein
VAVITDRRVAGEPVEEEEEETARVERSGEGVAVVLAEGRVETEVAEEGAVDVVEGDVDVAEEGDVDVAEEGDVCVAEEGYVDVAEEGDVCVVLAFAVVELVEDAGRTAVFAEGVLIRAGLFVMKDDLVGCFGEEGELGVAAAEGGGGAEAGVVVVTSVVVVAWIEAR